jgi:hypothetical protein
VRAPETDKPLARPGKNKRQHAELYTSHDGQWQILHLESWTHCALQQPFRPVAPAKWLIGDIIWNRIEI